MAEQNISYLLKEQNQFFHSGATLPVLSLIHILPLLTRKVSFILDMMKQLLSKSRALK